MDNSVYKCINIWEDDYMHVFINGTFFECSEVTAYGHRMAVWLSKTMRSFAYVCDCLQCVGAHECHVTIQLCIHIFPAYNTY